MGGMTCVFHGKDSEGIGIVTLSPEVGATASNPIAMASNLLPSLQRDGLHPSSDGLQPEML